MKNRIVKLFEGKKEKILSIYFTAGFPKLNSTVELVGLLQNAGVDLIEIGMPFSDPLADGPVIQHSSEEALKNGMTIKILFEQLKDIRKVAQLPIILMGYINPVLQYGVENFCKKAAELGVDGVILPDLPLQEYLNEYKIIFQKYGLLNIFLITPQTSDHRIHLIDDASVGFIYLVSSSSTTGGTQSINADKENYFKRIKNMQLKNPLVVGFGISDRASFNKATAYANGAIIGSAFVKELEHAADLKTFVPHFVNRIKS